MTEEETRSKEKNESFLLLYFFSENNDSSNHLRLCLKKVSEIFLTDLRVTRQI